MKIYYTEENNNSFDGELEQLCPFNEQVSHKRADGSEYSCPLFLWVIEENAMKMADYCTHNIDGSHCELCYTICDGTACADYDCCDKEMD